MHLWMLPLLDPVPTEEVCVLVSVCVCVDVCVCVGGMCVDVCACM